MRRERERGFALLLVLWAMVLLALIGSRIAASGRAEAQLAANVRDAAVTEAAADGAVQEAAFHLLDPTVRRWAADNLPRRLAMPGATVVVRVESESGKVNPNAVAGPLLVSILHVAGADSRTAGLVADSILQWRFPWTQPGANNPGLKAYRAAGLNYGPPGAPFRSLDEVGAVLGMTPALLARVRPYLSIYASAVPDPAQASPPVLAAMKDAFGGNLPDAGAAGAGGAEGANGDNANSRNAAVVAVTAVAAGPNGTRFARHAVLRVGGQSGADPVQVLDWGVPAA